MKKSKIQDIKETIAEMSYPIINITLGDSESKFIEEVDKLNTLVATSLSLIEEVERALRGIV